MTTINDGPTASPYKSGEFRVSPESFPGILSGYRPPVAAIFDRRIWVGTTLGLLPGFRWSIILSTLTMYPDSNKPQRQIDIENGDAALPANWKQEIVTFPDQSIPWTKAAPALAATASRLFLIWNEGDQRRLSFRASAYWSEDGGDPAWDGPLVLIPDAASGITAAPGDQQSEVTATAFGDDVILVAFSKIGGSGYVGAFHLADIDAKNGSWRARTGKAFPATTGNLSIDWFNGSTLPYRKTPGIAPPPPFQALITSGPWAPGDFGRWNLLIPLTGEGDVADSSGEWHDLKGTSAATVKRDPGGLMAFYGALGTAYLTSRGVYNTSKLIRTTALQPLERIESLAQTQHTHYMPFAPCVVYWTDKSRAYDVDVGGKTGTGYPTYEFVFYTGTTEAGLPNVSAR
jgi:hypothetical protein